MGSWTQLAAWLDRARQLVPAEDRRELGSPLRMIRRFVRFARAHGSHRAPEEPVGARDPSLVGLLAELFRLVGREYFRLRVEGLEHVPADGPVLLVGNHNGGLLPLDAFFTALAIHDHHGPERAVNVLVHDFLVEDPLFGRYARRLGLVRACHAGAQAALDRGGCVLVYPGSDVDTYRPFWQRDQICLAGRTGFVTLARRAGVPIVPVVSAGTHEQLIVLSRGEHLARWLGLHRLVRADVLPLVLALPWGVVPGFVPYWPLPAQTTVAFGEPIAPGHPDLYREVEGRMQAMLTALCRNRRLLRGRPADRS